MLNELKKFTSKLHIKILILLVIIASIGVSIAVIKSFCGTKYETKGKSATPVICNIQGKAAIPIIKEQFKSSKGILTIGKLNEALKYYKSKSGADKAAIDTDIKYPGIFNLMEKAYVLDDYVKEPAIFHKLKNMNDFYTRNIKLITQDLNNSENTYEPWEKNIILERAKTIDKPFIIDFSKNWIQMYPSFMICFMLIAISAIVIGSQLFSYEKEENMDILLVSFGDNSIKKIGRNKIKALLTFLTLETLISVIIISIAIFSIAGISAWNSQIQIQYFTSIYHLTFVEAYLLIIFTGWISILAIGMFTATLNAFIQKSYVTLILGVLITFIPIVVERLSVFPIFITKFFKMQPINGFFISENLKSLQIFNFIFFNTLTMTAIIINAIIILGICTFISPHLFSTRIKSS